MQQITITRPTQAWNVTVFHEALRAAYPVIDSISNSDNTIMVGYADDAPPETANLINDWILAYVPVVSPSVNVEEVRAALGDELANALAGGDQQDINYALINVLMQQAQAIAALQSVGG